MLLPRRRGFLVAGKWGLLPFSDHPCPDEAVGRPEKVTVPIFVRGCYFFTIAFWVDRVNGPPSDGNVTSPYAAMFLSAGRWMVML